MHRGPAETEDFFRELDLAGVGPGHRLLVFPPTVSLTTAVRSPERNRRIEIGAQNVHWEPEGAVTGELSAPMAVAAGASHVLVGHSERRTLFGETDRDVGLKAEAVVAAGATPVVCVGETLEERRAGEAEVVVERQLNHALATLARTTASFLVAYEPVWAIGTGETATSDDVHRAHAAIRSRLTEEMGPDRAAGVAILYGGSVGPANAAGLLRTPEVDGALVGGASLSPASFAAIARAAPSGGTGD